MGPYAQEMEALLRCGERSLLGHLTAAVHLELRVFKYGEPIDIILVGAGLRPRPGLRLHQVRAMPPDDRTTRDGLRLTTPARTIADLSPTLPAVQLQRLIEEAQVRGLATVDEFARAPAWRQITAEPMRVVATIAAALRAEATPLSA